MIRWKKWFAAAMVLCILLTMMPTALAAGNANICGEDLTWTFNSASGTLTITGTGDMYDYQKTASGDYGGDGTVGGEIFDTEIPTTVSTAPWNRYLGQIKKLVLPEGLTSVGAYAFYGCNTLKEVVLPAGLTTVEQGAFSGCTALTDVTVAGSPDCGADVFADSGVKRVTVAEGVEVYDAAMFAGLQLESLTVLDAWTEVENGASLQADKVVAANGSAAWKLAVEQGVQTEILEGEAAYALVRLAARVNGSVQDTLPGTAAVTVCVEVDKPADSGTVLAAAAAYDANGRLLTMQLLPVGAENGVYLLEASLRSNRGNVASVKVMLVESTTTLKPLADALKIA